VSEFIKLAKISDLSERQGKLFRVNDEEIALFKIGGALYAIDNVCPHQHISALHQGERDGLFVTCPMHGWTYSLETGKAVGGSGQVRTYEVKVVGPNVFVRLDAEE
jgi:3-phenylpropionate/trans-cinnamate dioxygenase ferredoxin subunit